MKFIGTTVHFPRRERFNEEHSKVIDEQRSKISTPGPRPLTTKLVQGVNAKGERASSRAGSRIGSKKSGKSMTKSDLSRYFIEKQRQLEEEMKSRVSKISKGSSRMSAFKQKFMKRLEEHNDEHTKAQNEQHEEEMLKQPEDQPTPRSEEETAQDSQQQD